MKNSLLPLLCALLFVSAAPAESNWPYWRGPNANGSADAGAAPPVEWGEDKNIKWKTPLPGEGSSTAIVWGDKVFVQTAVKAGQGGIANANGGPSAVAPAGGGGQREEGRRRRRPGGFGGGGGGGGGAPSEAHRFVLMCIDRKNGEVLWQQVAAEEVPNEGHHSSHAYGSHSPVTDGERVIGFFGSRGVFCYDMEGDLKWKRDLGDMQMRATFGEGNSAALYGDTLIVPWDNEGPSAVYALDVKSGETLWKTDRDEPSNWGSPLIFEHGGKAQVVLTGENFVRCYDLSSGVELWKCGGQTTRPVASPVTDGENVYAGSGFRGNYLAAIKLGGSGDLTRGESVVWDVDRNTPDIASLLLSGERLYYTSAKSGIVTCVEAGTGKVHWGPERLPGISVVYASPAAANGHVYLTGRDGTTVVFLDGESFKLVASNKLDDDIDGSPVFVGNEILLRGKHFLYCISEG